MSLAWGGYRNGRIPDSALIGGQQPDAHRTWVALVAACYAATGVRLGITEGYRDYATQVRYATNPPKVMGRPVVVAVPGTSNHGWGRALDINNYTVAWTWLTNNAWRYGWSWATGKASGERWHWEYVGAITTASSGTTTPIAEPETPDGETMSVIYAQINGEQTVWCIDRATTTRHAVTGPEWELLQNDQLYVGEPLRKLGVIGVAASVLAPFKIVTVPPTVSVGGNVTVSSPEFTPEQIQAIATAAATELAKRLGNG